MLSVPCQNACRQPQGIARRTHQRADRLHRYNVHSLINHPFQPSICGVARGVQARASEPETPRPSILVAEKLGQAGLDMLAEHGNVDCSYDMSPSDLEAKVSLCDALIVRSATKVTKEVFEAAKGRLKVVGRAGVGIDNVDLTAATENGVMVVNAPNANTVAAAEHGIALLTALARNVAQADASMKAGKWERGKYVGVSLVGKTLAVMGFGKVGADVARRAKGLGMTVIAHDPYASDEKARAVNVRLVTFNEAVQTADFISLHMPLTPGTKNMFNKDVFAQCKDGVRIINVARGGVIAEDDLLDAVNSGKVAQAALDVFSEEPPAAGSALVAHPDIICTPHLGASTKEAQVRPRPPRASLLAVPRSAAGLAAHPHNGDDEGDRCASTCRRESRSRLRRRSCRACRASSRRTPSTRRWCRPRCSRSCSRTSPSQLGSARLLCSSSQRPASRVRRPAPPCG